MRRIVLCSLLLLPLTAFARQQCEHSRPFELSPSLDGIDTVVFDVDGFNLDLKAAAGASAHLQGAACASSAEKLERLKFHHERRGDTLVVAMDYDNEGWEFNLFGENYTDMNLTATLPADVAVEVDTGSGDAEIEGVARLDLVVGSGDAVVRDVPGPVSVVVGSGDAKLTGVGPLKVGSVGSGDLEARQIGGDVVVGSIGSGDVDLIDVAGSVEVGSVGSGSLDVDIASGDLHVRSIGSGDVDHHRVAGIHDLPDED